MSRMGDLAIDQLNAEREAEEIADLLAALDNESPSGVNTSVYAYMGRSTIRSCARLIRKLLEENAAPRNNPDQRPEWECSGCHYKTREPIGRCKGYCFDPTGKSCDAVACPKCSRLHYWSSAA